MVGWDGMGGMGGWAYVLQPYQIQLETTNGVEQLTVFRTMAFW